MNLKTIVSKELNEEYYSIHHKSGLQILVYPKKGHSKTYAIFATKYGSIDNVFVSEQDEREIKVPEGIAHFLEHKLFESKEESAFERYAKTGADANAFTSFDKTAYLFSCTENFERSLRVLLDFVQNPYFTKESIAKEQGIIGQEINMYNDNAQWQVFFNTLKATYVLHPVREDIAGTIESISEITPELLYKCYNSFYNLSEMVLCVCGDIDVNTVLSIADEILKEKKTSNVKRIYPIEPINVSQKVIMKKLSVSMPLFNIGVKDNVKDLIGKEFLNRQATTEILLELIAGESSQLYLRLYQEGLINNSFSCDFMLSESFGIALIGGESCNPEKVYKELFLDIEKLKQNGIPKSDFDRCKKALYGKIVKRFNSVEMIANDLILCYITKVDIFDILNAYKNAVLEDAILRLNSFFNEQTSVISIVEPN